MVDLYEKRKSKLDIIENLLSTIQTEKRALNEDENIQVTNLRKEIIEIDNEIESKRKKNNVKKMEKFSLLKSIRNQVDVRTQPDEILNVIEAGKSVFNKAGVSTRGSILLPMEYRADIISGSAGDLAGREVVSEDKFDLIGALRAESVIFKAGANLLTNLQGDISIPVYAGTSSAWAYETSGATDGAGAFSEITLAPKRLTTYIDVSKQFLVQDSASAEALLYSDIINSIMEKLEASIFDATAAGQTRPAGIFNGASYAFSGTTTWAGVVSLETTLAENKSLRGKLAYVVSPKVLEKLKTTAKASNTAVFLVDGGTMNGYPVYTTTHVPNISGAASGATFGNFDDLVIGQWGGLDITVDPYSQAVNGKVRLVVNSYWSWAKRRDVSFSYGALA